MIVIGGATVTNAIIVTLSDNYVPINTVPLFFPL